MSDNINREEGGGPWLLDLDGDLAPGEFEVFNLESMEYNGRKGYFRPWLPLDTVLVKNLDTGNDLKVTYNGQYESVVEANAADTYGDVGVVRFRVENLGGSTVAAEDVVIQGSVEPYGADDQALEQKQRSPLEKAARNLIGL